MVDMLLKTRNQTIYIYIYIYIIKIVDPSRETSEGSLFNSYYTDVSH